MKRNDRQRRQNSGEDIERPYDLVFKIARQKKASNDLEISARFRFCVDVVMSRGVWEQLISHEPRDPATRLRKDEYARLEDVLHTLARVLAQSDERIIRFLSPVGNRNCKPVKLTAVRGSGLAPIKARLMLHDEEPHRTQQQPVGSAVLLASSNKLHNPAG